MFGLSILMQGPEVVEFSHFLPVALTFLLPLGLLLLISSAVPEAEAPATAVNLLLGWSAAALAYFGVGFAFQFGGIAQVSPHPDLRGLYWEWYPLDQSVEIGVARLWGVIALQGFGLSGEAATPGALLLFLNHVALAGAAAMIPIGALPLRARGGIALLIGLVSGGIVYPVAGNWLWGGGWLGHLGANLGLGHGLVDFGGASLIFLAGSLVALAALLFFKPMSRADSQLQPVEEVVVPLGPANRLTVYDEQPAAALEEPLPVTPMPSAYLPILGLLGAGLTLLGWFGLVTGLHIPTALNFSPAHAAVSGLLAALSAALAAAGYSWFTTRQFNPLMTARGFMAGLIVAMAGGPFIPIWIWLGTGLLLGLLLPLLIYLFNQGTRLADEGGTLATYGVSALISLLWVALFADGRAGQGWNGIGLTDYYGVAGQGVSGLLVGPGFVAAWPGQLQAQLLGLSLIAGWAFIWGVLLFQTATVVINAWVRTGLELAGPTPGETLKQEVGPQTEEAVTTHQVEPGG